MSIENPKLADEELPTEFEEAIDGLALGMFSIEQLRAGLAAVLQENTNAVAEIQEAIDAALRDGRLSDADYETLAADVDRLVSEDAPTEWSKNVDAFIDAQRKEALQSLGADVAITPPPVAPGKPLPNDEAGPAPEKLGPGVVLRNRFRLESHVEAGSMGEIYRATDFRKLEADSADPTVAIKVISEKFSRYPDALKALQQEAANGQRLSHPNIVRVFDFDRHGNHFYMTMEWLEGESLVSILNAHRFRPLPFERGMAIIEGMCKGLMYAHKLGVVHADIKPGNIFVTHQGEVKLLDFGIARAGHTAPGGFDPAVIGAHTPAYSSCEVLEGQIPTERDDIYSLACIVYRIFAGRRAFSGFTALESESHGREPKPIDNLSSGQWQALRRAMAYRREDRTPDVATFFAEFASAPRVEPVVAADEALDELEYDGASRMPFILGGAVSLAIAAAVAVSLWPREPLAPAAAPDAPAAVNLPSVQTPTPALDPLTIDTPDAEVAEAADRAEEPAAVDDGTTSAPTESGPVYLDLAQQRMDEGFLVEPAGDNATHYLRLAAAEDPESPAYRQGANRLTNLMMLEAMLAISDKNFSLAERWLGRAEELGAERDVTGRVSRELARAREAETQRESAAFATVFASTTPAAVLAGQNAEAPTAARDGQTAQTPTPASPAPRSAPAAQPAAAETPAEPARPEGAVAQTAAPEAAPDASAPTEAAAPAADRAAELADGQVAELPAAPAAAAAPEAVAPVPVVQPPEPPIAAPEPAAPEPLVAEAFAARQAEADVPAEPVFSEEIPLSELEFRRFVEPKYPRRNSASRTSGWVEVRFRVNAEGEVDDLQIINSEPAGLFDNAATRAVTRWKFKPRIVDGVPTPTYSGVRLRFDGSQ